MWGTASPAHEKAPRKWGAFRLFAALAAAVLLVGKMALGLLCGLLVVLVVSDLLFLAHDYLLS